ncbi:hypothetical protein HK102_011211, partial [Quaeritorhiza haematococci]
MEDNVQSQGQAQGQAPEGNAEADAGSKVSPLDELTKELELFRRELVVSVIEPTIDTTGSGSAGDVCGEEEVVVGGDETNRESESESGAVKGGSGESEDGGGSGEKSGDEKSDDADGGGAKFGNGVVSLRTTRSVKKFGALRTNGIRDEKPAENDTESKPVTHTTVTDTYEREQRQASLRTTSTPIPTDASEPTHTPTPEMKSTNDPNSTPPPEIKSDPPTPNPNVNMKPPTPTRQIGSLIKAFETLSTRQKPNTQTNSPTALPPKSPPKQMDVEKSQKGVEGTVGVDEHGAGLKKETSAAESQPMTVPVSVQMRSASGEGEKVDEVRARESLGMDEGHVESERVAAAEELEVEERVVYEVEMGVEERDDGNDKEEEKELVVGEGGEGAGEDLVIDTDVDSDLEEPDSGSEEEEVSEDEEENETDEEEEEADEDDSEGEEDDDEETSSS